MPSPVVPIPAATPARRLLAVAVDAAIYAAASAAFALVAAATDGFPHAVVTLAAVIALFAVFIGNEIVLVAGTGQSLGKRCTAIRVVDSRTGRLPFWQQVFWREVIRGAGFGYGWHPFAALGYFVVIGPWPIIDCVPAIADSRWHRALHDRWAHTVVIDARADYVPFDESDGADQIVGSSL